MNDDIKPVTINSPVILNGGCIIPPLLSPLITTPSPTGIVSLCNVSKFLLSSIPKTLAACQKIAASVTVLSVTLSSANFSDNGPTEILF